MDNMNFKDWLSLDESARRSLARTMGKFQGQAQRPTAILTAFRGDFDLNKNRQANKKLEALFKAHGLSFTPVIGAGQENEGGVEKISKEESYVVAPIAEMGEEEFVEIIRNLLFSPTGDGVEHAQWGAVVKLPSRPKAFLLHHNQEGKPTSPADYDAQDPVGKSARPRRGREMMVPWKGKEYPSGPDQYFTQMRSGPEASDTMKSDNEIAFGFKPRRRFTLSKGKSF